MTEPDLIRATGARSRLRLGLLAAVLLAAALGVATLLRGATAAPQSDGRVHLKVALNATYVRSVYTELVRSFEAEHPDIDIELQTPSDSWESQLQRTLLDAAAGDPPDISEQGFHLFPILVERGLGQPLDPMIAGETDWLGQGHTARLTNLGAYDDHVWGLPVRISAPVLFYNPNLVAAAGGDPETPPRTWAGLVDLAGRITASGGRRTGMFFDYAADGNWTFTTLINLQGRRLVSPDGRAVAFDEAAALRALRLLRDIGRSGFVDMTRAQARQSFAQGDTGFYVGSSTLFGSFQTASAGRFPVRVASLPPLAADARVPFGGGVLMILTDDPRKRAAAWKFLKHVTSPAAQTLIVKRTGSIPGNAAAITGEAYLRPFYEANPQYRVALGELDRAVTWQTFPGPMAVKMSSLVRGHLHDVITQQKTPEQAIARIRQDLALYATR